MNFLALLGALVLSYYRPLGQSDWLMKVFAPCARVVEHSFNGGKNHHGVIAWLLVALLPSLLIAIAYFFLLKINSLLGVLFGVVILYFTLRFSQFGQRSEQIAAALRDGRIDDARTLLASWEGSQSTSSYSAAEIARSAIEITLRRAHQGMFAPILWFVLLGPAGAMLYRLSHLLRQQWHEETAFNHFSIAAFSWLDWLPARVTAGGFAIAGDFEDAVYCWRTQAAAWSDKALGIILASGAGALGVRLGDALPSGDMVEFRPELGLGDEADADYLRSSVGLVWRVLVVMVVLLLLLTFANWLGH